MWIDQARGAVRWVCCMWELGRDAHVADWGILLCFQTGAASDPAQGRPLLL